MERAVGWLGVPGQRQECLTVDCCSLGMVDLVEHVGSSY
jgi:hypothetical protein